MKYTKQPISIPEQISKLKARGLAFNDVTKAAHYLSNISYYRLRAYTYPFQDNENPDHPFNKKISFEEIIDLYCFDRHLRILLFDAIEKIEIAFRTQIIHKFSLTYGSHWYLKPELYRDTSYFARHLENLITEVERSTETFISHYKEKYSSPPEPPAWMSLEVTSMSLLSKIFRNLIKCPEKKNITIYFGLKESFILESWMLCISNLRNICAHHSRLWNRRLVAKPILPHHPTHQFIKNTDIHPNKLYATLCCITYILNIISPANDFNSKLSSLMKTCPLTQEKEMGFPENWKEEALWQ